jgi:glycerophosphoryl diester phosphodiesterase
VVTLLKILIKGVLEFTSFNGDLLCIPIACRTLEESNDLVTISNESSYMILRLFRAFPFLLQILLFHVKRRGIIPLLWVMNNEDEYQKAYDYGAMGIVTDRPIEATKFYENKKIKLV